MKINKFLIIAFIIIQISLISGYSPKSSFDIVSESLEDPTKPRFYTITEVTPQEILLGYEVEADPYSGRTEEARFLYGGRLRDNGQVLITQRFYPSNFNPVEFLLWDDGELSHVYSYSPTNRFYSHHPHPINSSGSQILIQEFDPFGINPDVIVTFVDIDGNFHNETLGDFTYFYQLSNNGQAVIRRTFSEYKDEHRYWVNKYTYHNLWDNGVMGRELAKAVSRTWGDESWPETVNFRVRDLNDLGQMIFEETIGTSKNSNRHTQIGLILEDNSKIILHHIPDTGRPEYPHFLPRRLNNNTQVIGSKYLDLDTKMGFLWEDNEFTILTTSKMTMITPIEINDLGQVIGLGSLIENENNILVPMLYENGGLFVIQDLVDPNSEWTIGRPRQINNSGLILAEGEKNGERSILLLEPVEPLIFIPGIAGSVLEDLSTNTQRWPGILHSQRPLSLFPNDNPSPNIVATDAIRYGIESLNLSPTYAPLLEMLDEEGNYTEYEVNFVNGRASPRSAAGCDYENQKENNPNLFVFAYDWRKDNAIGAALLKEYIEGCIHQFYPGSPVNILAHSNGSLLSRRYILDNPEEHHVNKLITIGAPFLGAPKAIQVLETGDMGFIHVMDANMKYISNSFTGGHQLIPGEAYYTIAGNSEATAPLIEDGWDLNGDGLNTQGYSYEMLISLLDKRYGYDSNGNKFFNPGSTADVFHNYTAVQGHQDNWQTDNTGIQYYHIVGRQEEDRTIGQLLATVHISSCGQYIGCLFENVFEIVFTAGDGTVPLLSAGRIGLSEGSQDINLNAPTGELYIFQNDGNDAVEHLGITQNKDVHNLILDLLGSNDLDETANETQRFRTSKPFNQVNIQSQPARYLTMYGADSMIVSDAMGNETSIISGTFAREKVPGIDIYSIGDKVSTMVMSLNKPYTITMQASQQVDIDLRIGTSETTSNIIRYSSIKLPIDTIAQLALPSGAHENLRFDSNNDGVFDSEIVPDLNAVGEMVEDVIPPQIEVKLEPQESDVEVTLIATDDESGMDEMYYFIDETLYQYFEPFTINPDTTPMLHLLAYDVVGNRQAVDVDIVSLLQVDPTEPKPTDESVSIELTNTPQQNVNKDGTNSFIMWFITAGIFFILLLILTFWWLSQRQKPS